MSSLTTDELEQLEKRFAALEARTCRTVLRISATQPGATLAGIPASAIRSCYNYFRRLPYQTQEDRERLDEEETLALLRLEHTHNAT